MISFSASVASAVSVFWPGSSASISVGEVIATCGRVSGEMPLPTKSTKLSRKLALPVNTRYSAIGSVESGASTVTSCQRCVLPVLGTCAVPSSSPVGESRRSSIAPPSCVEATRKETLSMPVKFTGS